MSFMLYGINFTHTTARSAARDMFSSMKNTSTSATVFTPNLHILLAAKKHAPLCSLIKKGNIVLPDGMGISLLCRLSGLPRVPRVTGIDMGRVMLEYASRHALPVFLLGGRRGVAERAAQNLEKELPSLKICGVHHGYFDKARSSYANRAVIKEIAAARPALLIVCMGFPRQEKWICENLCSLPSVRLCMALGGALDVWSGDVRRAPLAVRVLGAEWLWRSAMAHTKPHNKKMGC